MKIIKLLYNSISGLGIKKQIEEFGSNLNQKHEFTFWLYFNSKENAEEAGKKAIKTGLKYYISAPIEKLNDSKWLCLLMYNHIPDEFILDEIIKFCQILAHEFKGDFDGWETKIEKG